MMAAELLGKPATIQLFWRGGATSFDGVLCSLLCSDDGLAVPCCELKTSHANNHQVLKVNAVCMQAGEAGSNCAVLLVLPVLGGQHTNSQVTLSVSIQTVPAPQQMQHVLLLKCDWYASGLILLV
jgi:hypothetical protein